MALVLLALPALAWARHACIRVDCEPIDNDNTGHGGCLSRIVEVGDMSVPWYPIIGGGGIAVTTNLGANAPKNVIDSTHDDRGDANTIRYTGHGPCASGGRDLQTCNHQGFWLLDIAPGSSYCQSVPNTAGGGVATGGDPNLNVSCFQPGPVYAVQTEAECTARACIGGVNDGAACATADSTCPGGVCGCRFVAWFCGGTGGHE